MTALDIALVSHAYRRPALQDVSFATRAGEFVVLLGLNGAGKTTLFSLIAGLLPLQSGSIAVMGHRLPQQRSPALAAAGFVFQQPSLDLDLSVAQALRYHAALHGLSRHDAAARIEQELRAFGLLERRRDLVRSLSGGQRRRVEIIRSLLHRPQLLVLDEPTVGLDVPTRSAILDRAHALCRERGVSVLWATHLLDEIRQGDRVLIIHQGRIVDDLRADESGNPIAAHFAALTASAA